MTDSTEVHSSVFVILDGFFTFIVCELSA